MTNGAELGRQVRDLGSALIASREENEAARDEAVRKHEDLVRLHHAMELAECREQTTAAENRALSEKIAARRIDCDREQKLVLAERLKWDRRLADLQAEIKSGQTRWRADLDDAQMRFDDELRELRNEIARRRDEAEHMDRERDLARSQVQELVRDQESLTQTLAAIEAARQVAAQQFQAEIARLAAELAEAEGRHESGVLRGEELFREVEELRAELDRQRSEPMSGLPAGRVPVVEILTVKARTDEGWPDHHPSGRFRAAVSSSSPQDEESSHAASGRLGLIGVGTSLQPSCFAEEPVSEAFPSDADLSLVRAQVAMLNKLLSTEKSSGHVLIYQKRLVEFSQKIREASRLTSNLASEVEQTRQRDQMQYHQYLLRRAVEIEKP